jgi:type IV pilus assembly protein PilC
MAKPATAAATKSRAPAASNTFSWEGVDKSGAKKKGEIVGANEAAIKAELRRQGIRPVAIRKKSALSRRRRGISPKDIAIFTRQLATMMAAGVPLVQAFEIVGRGHENPAMQDLIMAVKANVEAGSGLAESMAKHPRYFDDLVCSLVAAGEQSGTLETLLNKIALYKEKVEAIKGKIKKALFYPAAVIVFAFIITSILMIFVIPQFAELFKGFGADLPALTKVVIQISNVFVAYWWAIFGSIGAAVYGVLQIKRRSKAFNDALDRIVLKVPVIGPIINKATIARFARTLSTMFAAGMPLVESMTTVAQASGNIVYEGKIMRMRDEVSTGTQLNVSMKESGLFPNMVVQMVAIGEESGAVDAMLAKVADFYEEEVDNAVDGLTSLLEPLIMAFLGVVIGGLVIAMYLPIFKMGSVVGGKG